MNSADLSDLLISCYGTLRCTTSRMRRRLFILAALLLAAGVGAWLVVRSTLNPDVIRRAVESRLSAALGQPVSIGGVRVSAFPVPAVIGSDITIGSRRKTPDPIAPSVEPPDLELRRIHIVPRIRSLFRGPYVIRNATLEGLTVRIVRESGGWTFPAVVPVPGGDEAAGLIVERVRVDGARIRVLARSRGLIEQTSLIEDIEGDAVADGSGLKLSPIRGRIGSSAITGDAVMNAQEARLDFRMPEVKNQDLAAVLGLSATDAPGFVTLPNPASISLAIRIDRLKSRLSGTGALRAPDLSVHALRLQNVETPIRTDGVRITFDPMMFSMYGGSHTGKVVVDLPRSAWTLDSKMTGVDVGDSWRRTPDAMRTSTARRRPPLRCTPASAIPCHGASKAACTSRSSTASSASSRCWPPSTARFVSPKEARATRASNGCPRRSRSLAPSRERRLKPLAPVTSPRTTSCWRRATCGSRPPDGLASTARWISPAWRSCPPSAPQTPCEASASSRACETIAATSSCRSESAARWTIRRSASISKQPSADRSRKSCAADSRI